MIGVGSDAAISVGEWLLLWVPYSSLQICSRFLLSFAAECVKFQYVVLMLCCFSLWLGRAFQLPGRDKKMLLSCLYKELKRLFFTVYSCTIWRLHKMIYRVHFPFYLQHSRKTDLFFNGCV